MVETFESNPDMNKELETKYALEPYKNERKWLKKIVSTGTKARESAKSNWESFWWLRLSYNWRYEVPWVNQKENLGNRDKDKKRKKYTKPPFNDVPFADCRLNKHIWKVVYGTNKNQWVHIETYYSQRKRKWWALEIPWRHVADDGTIRDKDWYIVIASPKVPTEQTDPYPKGTKVMTTLWPWKVYDKWEMKWDWFDIFVDW